MRNKKKIILILGLIVILTIMFLYQKKLIIDFSLEPERIELIFDQNSEIFKFTLADEEYIRENYTMEYTHEENSLGDNISVISIQKPENIEDEFFTDKFIDYLKFKIPEINEEMLNIRDYSHANRILMEWHRGTKLFLTILLFMLVAIFFVRRIRNINKYLKKELEIYYLKEIVQLKIDKILEESIKLVILMFSGIFLLQWIIKFQFNIPGKYLPASNIFDFEFYRMLRSSLEPSLTSYGHLYIATLNKVKLLTLGFIILSITTFLLTIRKFNKEIVGGRDKYGESSI